MDVDHPLYEGKPPANNLLGLLWMIGTIVLVFGLAGAGVYFGSSLGEAPEYACVKVGQKFSTIDNDKEIAIQANHIVDMTINGTTNKVNCRTLSNPASGLMFAVSDFAGKQPLYVRTGNVISDPSGTLLYAHWRHLNGRPFRR